jgi:hypothetical protein
VLDSVPRETFQKVAGLLVFRVETLGMMSQDILKKYTSLGRLVSKESGSKDLGTLARFCARPLAKIGHASPNVALPKVLKKRSMTGILNNDVPQLWH